MTEDFVFRLWVMKNLIQEKKTENTSTTTNLSINEAMKEGKGQRGGLQFKEHNDKNKNNTP